MNFFLKRWLSESAAAHVPTGQRKLGIEDLEDRTVPAVTIPEVPTALPPVQTGSVDSRAGNGYAPKTVTANAYDPQTVINPANSLQIVTVSTNGSALNFSVSNNRGQTWATTSPGLNRLGDPLVLGGTLPVFDSPSVGFDRNNNLYVAYIQRNAANTSGALVVDKLTVSGGGFVSNVGPQTVIYRWANQDPVFNPVIGVNNLLPTFTDPDTNQVSTNFAAGRGVYVAWNTSATQTGFGDGQNVYIAPSVIMMAVSDNGGASFSTPQFVSDNGFDVGGRFNFDGTLRLRDVGVDPQVYFTHNTVTNAIQGGRLGFAWVGGTNTVGSPVTASGFTSDVSDPLNGNAANPLTVQQTFNAPLTGTAPPVGDVPAFNTGSGQIAGAATPTGGVLTARTTTYTQTVNITAANFTSLADLNVTLSVFSQDLSLMRIRLVPPSGRGLPTITLLESRSFLDGNGGTVARGVYADGSTPGVPGGGVGGLGLLPFAVGSNQYLHSATGLVFDQQSARRMNDPANLSPYILHLRPEDFDFFGETNGLDQFNGESAANLSGTWSLQITNYKANDASTPPITPSNLDQWKMEFVSRVDTGGYGFDTSSGLTTAASTDTNVGTLTAASPTFGVQGWYSVAVDDSLGSFSPYQGRTYVAYTGGGGNDTDIFVSYSDAGGGGGWTTPVRVNTDFATDGFSTDTRAQFQPTVTVDPTTGTVVVMWYDARWDASNARAATFIATSVDGGDTFSPNTFLNITKAATDAIDRTSVKIEPVPNNLATLVNGFGNHQGLVAYAGTIVPVWTGNTNVANSPTLMSAVATIAAGPRVLQADMGPVSDTFAPANTNGAVANDSFAIDGTRRLNAFYVRLDRPVDPATFTRSDVRLQYRDSTGAPAQDISSQVLGVAPLDEGGVRTYTSTGPVTSTTRLGVTSAASVITVGLAPAPNYVQDIRVRVSLTGGLSQDTTLRLTAPDGTVVRLSTGSGGTVPVGVAFADTTFDDAGTPIFSTTPPFGTVSGRDTFLVSNFGTGQFAQLTGVRSAGDWTLEAVNAAGTAVTITNWSLDLTTIDLGASRFLVTIAPQSKVGTYSYAIGPDISDRVRTATSTGNKMDQNNNGTTNDGAPIGGNTTVQSPIVVSGLAGPITTTRVTVGVKFTDPAASAANAADLRLRLIGPNGTTVTLANGNGTGTAGATFANTTFDDAGTPIATAPAPFGTVAPVQSLSAAFGGLAVRNGTWTLEVTNLTTGRVLQLTAWTLSIDGNPVGTSSTDQFANPQPVSGTPFTLPYATDSLPLIVPGPRVVSTAPVTTYDGSVSSIDVTFDRDMLASSFTPAQVIELRLPTGGTVSTGFTVTANPSGTPAALANRVFRVTFPRQEVNGYYAIQLGAGIRSTTGYAMDPNMNAGVEIVTGRVTNPAVAGTVSVDLNTRNIALAIPAAADASTPSVTTATLTVSDPFVITQLLATPIQVRLNITFPDVRKLLARLIAPDGTVIQLFTRVGQFGVTTFANFTNTVFNDFAPTNNLIQNGSAPFSNGPFLPQQTLSVLNGKVATGDWKLEVTNESTTQSGRIENWGLSLPQAVLGSGLGEPVNDRTTVSFRIFTSSPTQVQSTTAWTPIGPTVTDDLNSGDASVGVVTASASDPSDPSGNTVYVGGATGGLWKTNNFLTTDPRGPTWIPLTDNASPRALRISSITIVPRNNDPAQQSIILVGTGDADTGTAGVGFLRSTDGGRTFRLLDSTSNADATTTILPIDSPLRNHLFASNLTYVYKVVVDPVRLANGEFVVYAALGGSAATQGLWRSVDSARSWTRIQTGECTDFVLGPNRTALDANGTPFLVTADIAYAAFAGANGGVFFSDQIAIIGPGGMLRKDGGDGKPLFSNGFPNFQTFAVTPPPATPTSAPTKIVLATVNVTASTDPLAARIYQGWLYALVIGGTAPGLYMTKDFGANWTQVQIQTTGGVLTNDETLPNLYSVGADSRYDALVADATDPNVIYMGGLDGILRIDVSALSDPHAQVAQDNSKGGVGAQAGTASVGGIFPGNPQPDYFNRLRDPDQPFVTGATQIIGTGDSTNPPRFTNTGDNAMASRFNAFLGDALIRNMTTQFDPLTRKTRLVVVTERGVYTAVDAADPNPTQGLFANAAVLTQIGTAVSVNGTRNGNLALLDATQTAVQPSELAADLAGLYNRRLTDFFTGLPLPPAEQNSVPGMPIYTVADEGYVNAEPGILRAGDPTYGTDRWRGELNASPYVVYDGFTQADPRGSGTIYQYRPPAFATTAGGRSTAGGSTDVFLVTLPGQAPIGRSNGLFINGEDATNGEWTTTRTAYFAVNPADPNGVVISAPLGGRVFVTTDQGFNWFEKGSPAQFGNSQGTALAFGGRDPASLSANSFMYNGTAAGRVFVTFTGGGFAANSWIDISAGLSGGRILKIVANPKGGTYDAYAITATGVFYKADARTAAAWVNVTGNLFAVTKPVFGETTVRPILSALTALEVDWRFAQPVLYAAGDVGVFRSTNQGAAWALFPAIANGAAVEGGYLPNAAVTDLDLVYGSLNATGVPDESSGMNVLVATTYGRSLYAIRLDANAVPPGLGTSGPWVNTAPLVQPNAAGQASISLTFGDPDNPVVANRILVKVDPTTLTAANVSVVGPGGVVVPFTVTDVSATLPGGTESASNKFRLDFSPPVNGTYTLLLNTNVLDTAGRKLNQNRNGTNGERPADNFSQSYAVTTVNQPPTVTAIANQGQSAGNPVGPLAFTVGDLETPAASLVVSAVSSNTAVLPTGNIVLGGTGANRTITVTPAAPGISTVTLTVTDAGGRTAATTFTLSSSATLVPFADNFDRQDAPNLGGNWVIQSGTAVGSLNSALATSPAVVATVTGVSQVNSVAQATVTLATSGTSSSALVARYGAAAGGVSMYLGGLAIEAGAVTARISKIINGTATELVRSATVPTASQYLLRFEVVNDSLKLFVNGQLAAFVYDISLSATGLTGLRLTNGNRLDDYSVDNIVLTPPAPLPAPPATSALDPFTQPDGTQLSRDWRDRLGNLSVSGNKAVGQAAGANLSTYNVVQATADAGAQAVASFTAANQSVGVVLRYTGVPGAAGQNMYLGSLTFLGGNQVQASIQKNVGGVWSPVLLLNGQPATVTVDGTGGLLRFEAIGSYLKLSLDGVRLLTGFDTSLTTGVLGLRTNQGGAADDFVAFALTATPATLPYSDAFTASPPLQQLAPTWTERAGSFTVASGAAQALSAGANTATLNGVSAADVAVSATVQTQVGGLLATGLVARYTGIGDTGNATTSMYWGALNVFGAQPYTQYSAQIWKIVNGVATNLTFNAVPILPVDAAGKVLRFEVFGSSLKLYLDDVLLCFVVDTSITAAGSVGLRAGQGAVLDNFNADVRARVTPTLPFHDSFAANPPRQTLATTWQERSGYYTINAAGQAVGRSVGQVNVATLNGVNAADATVSADLFFTAAGQTAQLIGRYQGTGGTGDSNYYVAALTTQASGDALLRILKNVNGVLTELGRTTLAGYFSGGFTTPVTAFRFKLLGTQLSILTGATTQLTVTDTTASPPFTTGSVGVRVSAGVAVDEFDVTSP